ncbi:MAG: hypothetical protein K8F91_21690, partial [Candidatus Obscuribacterales bacterium]|nr:hypothetical protein [Candidatus Obscuribacterales bacterium]
MKERISKFVQAILPAVVVGLMAVPTAHAQENFVPADTAFRRIERMAPDSISGEVLHLNEYLGDKLFRTTIRYKDGVVKVQEFQSSGVLKGEVVTATDGTTTITLYTADGKGLFRVTELKNQRVEQKEYRDDGKTLWTSTVLTQSGRLVEYFDASGRMRVRRAFLPQGVMRVTVLDPQGKTSYTQIWISGIAGYVLS